MRFFILFLCLAFVVADEDEFEITEKAFFDISVNGTAWGRIQLGLYGEILPRTVQNFMELCLSPEGSGYKGSRIHKVLRDMILGGDYEYGDGTGGESVYGPTFDDENFRVSHLTPGTISMSNRRIPHTNGSQFFITIKPAPHFDGKHVAFGRVIGGLDFVERLADFPANERGRPYADIIISDCGEM